MRRSGDPLTALVCPRKEPFHGSNQSQLSVCCSENTGPLDEAGLPAIPFMETKNMRSLDLAFEELSLHLHVVTAVAKDPSSSAF